MKKTKKSISILLSLVMVLTMSVCAYANETDSSSVKAPGYGTLKGYLESAGIGAMGYHETTVTYNNDNAQLGIKSVIKDINGNDISENSTLSDRGEIEHYWQWYPLSEGMYSIYATHEVRNGSKYGAKAVYTYTKI